MDIKLDSLTSDGVPFEVVSIVVHQDGRRPVAVFTGSEDAEQAKEIGLTVEEFSHFARMIISLAQRSDDYRVVA